MRRHPGTRKTMLAIVIAILLGIFLPPLVNVNRYRSNIATSISTAVGRSVTVGHVELRLLPQPGFDLRNVEVADDPSISSEYLLHADRVTAYLRLSSLWRGRLEIARLSLTDPSLNVVHAEDGRWNLETLLLRNAQIPSAPTAQAHFENARRRFPYIEATGGRINFKFGLEKKAFTLTDADFALWLQSENNWSMRLEARPYRIDTHVTDTGTVKMEADFQRNSMLRYTPVKLSLTWHDGQLGQVTKLLSGRDHGWRGGTTIEITGTGTPANLALVSDLRVDDFRRYDIFGGGAMRLGAHCSGHLIAPEEKLAFLDCESPIGDGKVELQGTVQRFREPFYELVMAGHNVALNSVMSFVRHAKRDLPEDLSAGGTTDFSFSAHKDSVPGAPTLWSGEGSTTDPTMHSRALGPDLAIGTLTYVMGPESPEKPKRSGRAAKSEAPPSQPQEVNLFRLAVAPFGLQLGAAAPTNAQAVVTASGFNVAIAGDSDLARALQVARAFGIDIPKVAANGAAKLDLRVEGRWTGFEAPVLTGTAQIKNAHADVPGIIETMQVSSAAISMTPESLTLQNVAAAFEHGPNFTGSATVPRECSGPCPITFAVHADELSPERLDQILDPRFRKHPWYNFFMPHPADPKNPLLTANATGQLAVDRWNMEGTQLTHVTGSVRIAAPQVAVVDLHGDLLGGQHTGTWQADFSGDKPVFSGNGKITHASLAQLGNAMQDVWATGTADLSYQLKMIGSSPSDLRNSASGIGEFSIHDGLLRRMSLDGKAAPLKLTRFDGTIALRDGNFVLSDAKLQSGSAVYTVQGTASWNRDLNFTLTDALRNYALSGTLDRPVVKAAPVAAASVETKP
ncbi:MAG TPA: AsmA family protein [Candidatus Koribacter sp.]